MEAEQVVDERVADEDNEVIHTYMYLKVTFVCIHSVW